MKHLDALRAKAAKAVARQKELLELSVNESREMTAAEQTEFDQCETDAESAMKAINRLKAVNARSDALATAERTTAERPAPGNPVDRVTVNDPARIQVGRSISHLERIGICAWAAAKAKHYPTKSALTHLEEAGFQTIADECREVRDHMIRERTFNTITAGTGDNTITTPLSAEWIETLRNESIFMRGGPVPVDLSYGSLKMSGGNAGASGTYTAEGSDLGYTQMSTRNIDMSAKHLGAITSMSNYNIEVSPFAVASIVGDDLQMGIVLAMDAAGLRGDGTGNNPAGVSTLVAGAHKYASAALVVEPTLAQIDTDIKGMLTKIRASNIPVRRRRWLMCNRVFTYLQFMRDADGAYVYPGLQLASPVWYDNIPVLISEQIPSTLGATTNESEIYLVDFGHVLIGEARAITLKSSTEASYKNAGGTLVSAFSLDETVIRATCSHDFDMRHNKAAVVLTQVRWGA